MKLRWTWSRSSHPNEQSHMFREKLNIRFYSPKTSWPNVKSFFWMRRSHRGRRLPWTRSSREKCWQLLFCKFFRVVKVFGMSCIWRHQAQGLKFAHCPLLYVSASNLGLTQHIANLQPHPPFKWELPPSHVHRLYTVQNYKLLVLILFLIKKSFAPHARHAEKETFGIFI